MSIRNIALVAASVFLFAACQGSGDPRGSRQFTDVPPPATIVETDVLETEPGYRGEVLGAEVIGKQPADDYQAVEITIPVDPDTVDRVGVVAPTGEEIKQKRAAEIVRDYENNNVGIKIFLPGRKDWEFRLRLIDQEGDNN